MTFICCLEVQLASKDNVFAVRVVFEVEVMLG